MPAVAARAPARGTAQHDPGRIAGRSSLAADSRLLQVASVDHPGERWASALAASAMCWSPANLGLWNSAPAPGRPGREVADVLGETGQSLGENVRPEMEQRFGRGFGHVRVHDGPAAWKAAASVSAEAFTAGDHVVFAAGMYRPGSSEGRYLIAHELAHTMQRPSAPTLWRQPQATAQPTPQSPTATPQSAPARSCPTPTPVCERALTAITAQAINQLNTALDTLNDYSATKIVAAPETRREKAEHVRVAAFLRAYFNTTDPMDAEAISYRLARIRNALAAGEVCMTCEQCSLGAGGTIKEGYSPDAMRFTLCNTAGSPPSVASTMIHEGAHAVLPEIGVQDKPVAHHLNVQDRAYHGERLITHLSTVEALTNADSYSELVKGLNSGGPVPTEPGARDTIVRCPDRSAVETGLGRAQVAARRLTEWLAGAVELVDQQHVSLAHIGGPTADRLRSSFPGITTLADLRQLSNDAEVVFNYFTSPETVKCARAGASCPGDRLGFVSEYAVTGTTIRKLPSMIDSSGNINLCPAWFSASDDDRTRSSYAFVASAYLGGARIQRLSPDDAMRLATLATAALAETLPPPRATSALEHLSH